MIINTPQKKYEGQAPSLYTPLDPKYFYPAKPSLQGGYLIPKCFEEQTTSPVTGLDDLMTQKRDIIHSKIQMVTSEIGQRYEMKTQNLAEICHDQCTCRNLIEQMGDLYLNKSKIELEKKILDLEQEKRKEKSGYFRDILFLRKELRESLIDELEEEQKALFFADPVEEKICNP